MLNGNSHTRSHSSITRRPHCLLLHMDAQQASRLGKHLQFTERDTAERCGDNEHDHAERKNRLGQCSSEDRPTHQREPDATRQHRRTQGPESTTTV